MTSIIGSNYLSDEITSDPNAARLFGSLGELFISEKRKVSDYQAQLIHAGMRATELEEHVLALQKGVLERESRTREVENEVSLLRSRVEVSEASLQATQNKYRHLESLQSKYNELEAINASVLDEMKEERDMRLQIQKQHNEDKMAYSTELMQLKEALERTGLERDSARTQLDSIRSMLQIVRQ